MRRSVALQHGALLGARVDDGALPLVRVAKSIIRYQCRFCSPQGVRIKPCAKGTNSPSTAPGRDGGATRGRCATMEKQNKGPDPFLCHPALVGPNHCQQTLLSSTKKTQQGSDSAMTTLVCVAKSVKQYQCPCYSSQGVRIRTCAKGTNSPSAKPRRDLSLIHI